MRFFVRLLFPALVAFLVGVGFSSYVFSSYPFAATFLCIGFVALGYGILPRGSKYVPLVVVVALGIALGIFRYELWESAPVDPILRSQVGKEVFLRAMVVDEPDIREERTHLTVLFKEMERGGALLPTSGRALLLVPHYPEYAYGDVLEVKGKLELPKKFANKDGARTFDYPGYLKAKGISYQLFSPQVEMVGREQGNPIMAALFSLKHAFLKNIARTISEPGSALAGGILFGGKQSLGEEWTQHFRVVGLVHVVVLSGYNMTIVAEYLGKFFQFLKFGFYGSISVSALGIIFFALMAGAGATVVRAAIMALLVLLARLTGRTYAMGRALLFAGVLMVLQNPGILAHDPSFQLSFLASLGLVYAAPLIERRLTRLKNVPWLREIVTATLSTQLFVLPLLFYQTGMFSIVALPANLLVLPVVPLAMLFAFLTGLLGFVGDLLAFLPGLPAAGLLSWMLLTTRLGVMVPFAAITVPPISGVFVLLLYGVLGFFVWRISSRQKP